jgi:hypothetical protein
MSSSVQVAVVPAKTSTGHQDITTTDLKGATPKAVMFLYSHAISNGAITANESFGLVFEWRYKLFPNWSVRKRYKMSSING